MLVASGAGILIAQKLGADKRHEARTIASMAVTITAGIGLVVSIVLYVGAAMFADVLQVPTELQSLAVSYMSLVGAGMIFTALGTSLSICVRNTGDTRSPMYIAIGMNVVHVILNALFIFGWLGFPKWGLFGVALSTVIVRFAACLLLIRLFRHAYGEKIGWREFIHFDLRLLKDVVRIGWPLSVNGASWTVSQVVIFSMIGWMGAEQLATRTYLNTMESFAYMIGWSLAMAAQIQIAHLYGLGRLKEAYYSCYKALGAGMVMVTLNTLLLLLFRGPILHSFTTDPSIVQTAVNLLWLNLLLQPGKMMNMAIGQSVSAIGDSRFMMMVSLPSMWLVAVGVGYLLGLPLEWGLYGIYTGMILDEYLRGAIMWLRWRKHRRSGLFSPAFRQEEQGKPVSATM
jgi:putative MATE family efflux protein